MTVVNSKSIARLTTQERAALVQVLLAKRSQWSLQPLTVIPGDKTSQRQVKEAIRRLEKLMPPEFIPGPMPMIVCRYRMQRFAQSTRNMEGSQISVETIRRQIHKLITAAGKSDDAAVDICLNKMAPQAKHYVAVSMQLPDRRIGTYYDGSFDGITRNHLLQSARRALDHPNLGKRARGRQPDRAGDALIWSVYRAFPPYTGGIPRVWAHGRGFSDFIAVVAVLLELAGDSRHEATLRDRCRKTLKQEPRPPFDGLLFSGRV